MKNSFVLYVLVNDDSSLLTPHESSNEIYKSSTTDEIAGRCKWLTLTC